jgi:O-antigen ligase
MLHPGTFAELSNRAAGFPGNANFAALTAVILCSAGLHLGEDCGHGRTRSSIVLDMLILFSTFTVVTMTMSRSGLLNFCVMFSIFLFFRVFWSKGSVAQRTKELVAVTSLVLAAISVTMWLSTVSASDNQNNRLTRFLNQQQVDDGSAGTRLAAVHDSIRLIEEAPWLGHGTGFARTMNELPHNMYLQQWVNNGILGIGAYLVLLASTFHTFFSRGYRNGQALVLAAAVGGIFSHNILDLRPFLILLGIMLSHSYRVQQRQDTLALPVLHRSGTTHSFELQ